MNLTLSNRHPAGRLAAALLLAGVLAGCEQISPKSSDDLGADAVQLSCEGCHTHRSYLQRLAVEEVEAGSGGG